MAEKHISVTRIEHQCLGCGAMFYPKRYDRTAFCSRECGIPGSQKIRALRRTSGRVSFSLFKRRCVSCNRITTSRRRSTRQPYYCSAKCTPKITIITGTCSNCGVLFDRRIDGASRFMCSISCALESKAKARRRAKAKRRAVERGSTEARNLDPMAVFARDGWRCKICGVRTPATRRGKAVPNAPELDHIIPVSKGGSHTYANVQCACRSCNLKKGAVTYGQLNMFCDPVG